MEKIIVPIDFSEQSEYALETAANIAQKHNSKLIVLHMLELSNAIFTASENSINEEVSFYMKIVRQRFDEFLKKPYLEGLEITTVVKHFKVFSEVNKIAQKQNADLVVMGSQGASVVKEVLIGSNTQKVVRHSNVPVLIIKHNPILLDFKKVVFASDFSEECVEAYLKAKSTFEKLEAKMQLVYVNTPNGNFKSSIEINDIIKKFKNKTDCNLDDFTKITVVSDYTIEKGILNFANEISADLIAVATHGRKGVAHFFEGSISEGVVNHSALPVITFKI